MSQLVRVDFHGDSLECLRNDEGVWVSLKRVCEAVGVDQDGQRRKLAGKPWASTELMSVQLDGEGQRREMMMLHLHSLPMWLATIDAERVSDEVKID